MTKQRLFDILESKDRPDQLSRKFNAFIFALILERRKMETKRSLEEALELAAQHEEEQASGGFGVELCPACGYETFAVDAHSSGDVLSSGECLYCNFSRSYTEVEDEVEAFVPPVATGENM